MENLICNAYGYLEYSKDFDLYVKFDTEGRALKSLEEHWVTLEKAYNTCTQYMTDEAIAQAQALVMGEL